ncbi:MAG TPA: DUF2155 domain-containing protein [Paracoccus sp.]|nr:DUF2155 domain-containing protein [Paracoccus sp. (in: a-proteobacteria)]
MIARASLMALSLSLAVAAPLAAQDMAGMASSDGVYLRGLDKVSGVTTDLAVAVGESVSFGRMEISLVSCRYPAEDAAADAFAFLDIRHETRGEQLFHGWMIASSPALNALDHARYDVWVIGCQ